MMAMPQWLSTLLKTWFIQELWRNFKLFGPIVLGFILSQSLTIVSLIFCGHYPKDTALVLEGAGLAISVITLTAYLVMMGMGSAMDTLATQAYGAGSYKKVGVYLQRGIIIHAIALLVVLSLWLNIESILNLLHQPPCAIQYTVSFLRGFYFSLPALLGFFLVQKFLQAQRIVYPFIIAEAAATVVSILAHYLLMFVADLGILGAGIALGLAQWASLVFILLTIWICKLHKGSWDGWSWECLNDWGQYVKYSIPGLFISVAEMAIYEVGVFVVGLTGSIQQSILVVLFQFFYIVITVSYSLRTTNTVRVGNELGAGNTTGAKRAVFVSVCGASLWLVPLMILVLSLKNYIPMIFTSDPTVLQAFNYHIYVLAVTIFCDALLNCQAGAVIGIGWQHIGAVINITCSWVVGIPVAIVLAIVVKLGALGYITGVATAAVLMLCSYSITMFTVNWNKRAEVAQKMAIMHQKEKMSEESESKSNHTNADSSESNHKAKSEKNEKKSAARWKIVILRILIAAPFIILCVGAGVVSGTVVYHSTPCNTAITAGNETEFHPHESPSGTVLSMDHVTTSIPLCTDCHTSTGAITTTAINPSLLPAPTPRLNI